MRNLFLLLVGFVIIYSNLSAQSFVIDFEGSALGTKCEIYADALGAGNGFRAFATGSGGFGGAQISNFGAFLAPLITGQSCLIPPDNFVVLSADDVFSGVTAGMSDVTVTVFAKDGSVLESILSFTGFYEYSETFGAISFGNAAGGSPVVDNITLLFGVAPAARINEKDIAAPVALFCYPQGGGVDIYTVEDSVGTFLTRVFPADILRAMAKAESSGSNTAIYNDGTVSLWILGTGEMQVNANDYVGFLDYVDTCGALPEDIDLAEMPSRPRDEFVIINRPR